MADPLQDAARKYVGAVSAATGWDFTTIARRAGLSSSTLTRFMNNPDIRHVLSARSIAKIAAASGVPVPPELGGAASTSSGGTGHAPEFVRSPAGVPPPGARDLPVRGHAKGGSIGTYFFEQGAVQAYVERPWFLMGVPSAYAVYIQNDSMEPVFRHGHLAYVNPSVPVSAGDDVVIHLRDEQGFVKRLVRRTARALIAEQFNPPKQLEWAADKVAAVHLIVASLRIRS